MRQVYRYKDADMAACHNCATVHHQRGEDEKLRGVINLTYPSGNVRQAVEEHVRNYRHTDGTPCFFSEWPIGKVVARSRRAWGLRLYRHTPEDAV